MAKCGNILMNISAIANVATMKRHSCYSGILINTSAMLNVLIAQRCRRCTFYILAFYHGIPRRKSTTPTALTSSLHA